MRVFTFNGLRILNQSNEHLKIGSRKAEGLAVYLALADAPKPREVLADLLWDDRTQSQAMGNLRRELSTLRKHFPDQVEITRDFAQLHIWSDVTALDASVSKFVAHQGADALETLKEALDRYQGEFLAGFSIKNGSQFEDWVSTERERLRLLALKGWSSMASYFETRGLLAEGVSAARQRIRIGPLQESGYRQLMALLATNGQRAEALTIYDQCVDVLNAELGVEPDQLTKELYSQILANELMPVFRDGRVLDIPSEPKEGPQPKTNLPLSREFFVGREREIDQIGIILREPHTRLLTILGPGGMGKTSLALAVGHQMLSDFTDGVFFISLIPLSSHTQIVNAICDTLGFPAEAHEADKLAQMLGPANCLLILDNIEHLLSEGGQSDLRDINHLLTRCPKVKILVTSRARLQLKRETLFPLDGLLETLDPIKDSGVELFIQQAQQLDPHFLPSRDVCTTIQAICRLVGGMPLAIKLAASWSHLLSVNEIQEELKQNLDLLESEARDANPRHQSMRAVLDATWERLSEKEQKIFSYLCITVDGFDRKGAKGVAGASMLDLSKLSNKSLIRFNRETERYEIHELLRQYGIERLISQDQHQLARSKHGTFYLALLQEHEWHDREETRKNFGNHAQAWRWAAANQAFDLLYKTVSHIYLTPVWDDLREETLSILKRETDDQLEVWYSIYLRRYPPTSAEREVIKEAEAFYRRRGSLEDLSRSLNRLGDIEINGGNLSQSIEYIMEAIEVADSIGTQDALDRAQSARLSLARAYVKMGKFKDALTIYEGCVVRYEATENLDHANAVLLSIQDLHLFSGEITLAHAILWDCINYSDKNLSRHSSWNRLFLSYFEFLKGDFDLCHEYTFTIERHQKQDRQNYPQHNIDQFLGLDRLITNQYQDAITLYQRYWDQCLNNYWWSPFQELNILWGLALSHYGLGDFQKMRQFTLDGLKIGIDFPELRISVIMLPVASLLFAKQNMWQEGVELYALTYTKLNEWGGWLNKWDIFIDLAATLRTKLTNDQYAEAWERGGNSDLIDTLRRTQDKLKT